VTRCVIFFDIDGTLLDTGGAGQSAMERALIEDFNLQAPFSGVSTAGRTDRGIADEIFARYGLADTESERQRFRHRYLHHLPQSLKELEGALLPGVVPLLQQLKELDDVVLSLLTGNYAEGAWIKLQHFNIHEYFETGGFGDHHACRNEMARHAAEAIRGYLQLNEQSPRMIVIGDTPADVECARAINATAVAVATGSFSHQQLQQTAPDHLFLDLTQPDDFIRRVLAPTV
jgi:phosphoglycolate phosphatase